MLALGAALAGQLVLGQGSWLAGGLLFGAAALLLGSAALASPPPEALTPAVGPPDPDTDRPPAADSGTDSLAVTDPDTDSAAPTDPAPPLDSLIGGRWGAVALLAVTALAAVFRLPLQGTLPPGLATPEARLGLDAVQILTGHLTAAAWDGWPIFHLLTVGSVAALGQTQLAVRLPAILGGIAFVGAIYLLGRQLGGTLLGAIAGLFGAALFWHVDATRAAWGYGAWGLSAEALGVAVMLRAGRQRLPLTAGFAGVLLGLALQVSWTAIPAILVGGLLAARQTGEDSGWRLPARSVLAPFLVYFAIAAGPVVSGLTIPDREQSLRPVISSEQPASFRERLGRLALAFNVAGDPSPLHNLQAQPQLDTVTAALLVLGLALAVTRWRSQGGAPLLIWLLGTLGISALTGRGTPPDSLAAFHAVTPILLLAASALLAVCGQLPESAPTAPRWRTDLLLVLLGAMLAINAHTVFVRRPADAAAWAAFRSAEAMAAQEINRLLPGSAIFLADVWLDDPTIRFLAPGMPQPRRMDTSSTLPLREDVTFAYFAPGHQEIVAEDLERLYENGEIDRFRSPLDDTQVVLRTFRGPSKVVAAARGVTLRVTSPDRSRTTRLTLPSFDLRWPIPGESSRGATLELFTALSVDTAGAYRFRLDGPTDAILEINGAPVGRAGAEIMTALAAGSQRVRVLTTTDGDGGISVRWQPPGASDMVAIPFDQLYREQRASSGLLAAYRAGSDPVTAPEILRVERHIQREANPPPLPRPYTLDMVGILDAPKAGTYRFRLTGSGPVGMWLDGQPVPLGERPNDEPTSIVLAEGDHAIRLRLLDESEPTRFNLAWAPPGEDWGAIPTSRFTPPVGSVDAMMLTDSRPEPAILALGTPRILWLASLDGEPRAVAVGPDGGVYVTNATTRETQSIRSPSDLPIPLPGSGASIPADVEIGPDGHVWVLDALDGQLRRIDPASGAVTLIGERDLGLYRPRGFALAPDGTILVADTGGSRIVRLTADGSLIATIGPEVGGPGRLRQPTDVAVTANGDLYAVNGEGGAVLHLSPAGEYIGQWTVLPSDTERGSHIAVGPDGSIWISEPDGRRISRFTPTGVPAGVVDQTREGRLLRAPVGIAVGRDGALYVADVSLRAVIAIGFRP